MMKTISTLLLCAALTQPVLAQQVAVTNFKDTLAVRPDTSYWQKSFSGGINFNQASFNNWTGGGINSVALGGLVAARALYEKEKWSWDNTADLQLGFLKQKDFTRKASDQIMLNSVAGYKIAPKWDLIFSGLFTSYFAPGYLYDKLPANETRFKISNFFSPAQLTFGFGVAYKPSDAFTIRFSPLAPRFTFLSDQSVRYSLDANGMPVRNPNAKVYGVEPGKSVRAEWLAAQLQAVFTKNLTENINLSAKYLMYANYQTLDAIDHRFDILMTAKLTRYLTTTFGLISLFDKDFSDKWQLQQTLGLGLGYNVSTFRKKK